MIVNIKANLLNPQLPLDYRPAIVSMVKAALSKHYPDSYTSFYESGARQKSFTFSVALNKPKFEKEQILLGDTAVKISLSSYDECDSMVLYNAFQKSKGYSHPLAGENFITVVSVDVQPSPTVYDNNIVVKFLSPLVVREHIAGTPDQYYVYNDDKFGSALQKIVSRQLGREVSLSIEAVSPKMTVVMAFGTKIRATLGSFRLSGEPEILNVLLKGGMGSRRSEGFGHFIMTGRWSDE